MGTFIQGDSHAAAPELNDRNDLYFIRFNDATAAWESWLYLAERGTFHLLLSDGDWNIDGDINNDGECVWRWLSNPNFGPIVPGGIRFMRRVRNGDVDRDFDADLTDFAASTAPWMEHPSLPDCLTGPGDFDRLCRCRFYDMGHDRDVDLGDFAQFQNAFGQLVDPTADCCDTTHGPGCNDADVEACVCAVLPDCCTTDWDASCVVAVGLLGCGTCE